MSVANSLVRRIIFSSAYCRLGLSWVYSSIRSLDRGGGILRLGKTSARFHTIDRSNLPVELQTTRTQSCPRWHPLFESDNAEATL